jgi:hypothetical protein
MNMQPIDKSALCLPQRSPKFAPYRVVSSDLLLKEIIYRQNQLNYTQNSSAFDPAESQNRYVADTIETYRQFLGGILRSGYDFKTVEETIKATDNHAVIRHDVDGDLPAALRCAQIEKSLGIRSTYYFLHTSPYYGAANGKMFLRNEACADIYLQIQSLGHEVGLHTDTLWIYQNWGMDGVDGLIAELNWLRSVGLRIVGTAPHNSPDVYGGIANSDIFVGRHHQETALHNVRTPHELDVERAEGIPVRSVDEMALGLVYEADDMWNRECIVDWISIANFDSNVRMLSWNKSPESAMSKLLVKNPELFEKMQPIMRHMKEKQWRYPHSDVLDAFLPPDVPHIVYLSVHPEYYGRRRFNMAWP